MRPVVLPLGPDDPPEIDGFLLAGRLGEGGQGIVYLARARTGALVALKVLTSVDARTRERLAREVSALASVAPFCTARVLTAAMGGPRPYIVSEFVDGPSLALRVRERGPLSGGELERLFVGTATALAAIHAAGVVHRDFKPGNVLLGPDGPRVVDFGIARSAGASTMTSGLIGTPAYLAPEQISGSPASSASDVFTWAATMVYAATGANPFGADTVPAVLHRVLHAEVDLGPLPPRLRGVLATCLSKDPRQRPSAGSLMITLVSPEVPSNGRFPAAAPAGGPTSRTNESAPRTNGSAPRTNGSTDRGARGVLVGSAFTMVAVGMAGIAIWLTQDPPPASSANATVTSSSTPRTTPSAKSVKPIDQATPTPPPVQETTATDLTIPGKFAGTWAGHTQSINPADSDGAENTLVLKKGAASAAWTEKDSIADCAATLTLTKVAGDELTFALDGPSGGCVGGTITLEYRSNQILYTWTDIPGPGIDRQTGDLTKK